MSTRKIIMFELNEVPYRVIDLFDNAYPNSALTRLLKKSRQYETYIEEPTDGLAPTKTWPTVHRGVNYDKHGIADFGQPLDEVDRKFPPIWKLTTSNGIKTGVFGSLLTYQLPENLNNYAFYVPEAFASEPLTYPKTLSAFQEFNLVMSRASVRNVSQKVDWNSARKLLFNSVNLGLSLQTLWEIGKQLTLEKINPIVKTRRRTFQTLLGFDIFIKQLQCYKPNFTTFFTNHVAAAMHRYWAATFPEDYADFQLTNKWGFEFRNEINVTMKYTDVMLERLVRFVDTNPDYLLLIVTGMGQAALSAKPTTSFLRIIDLDRFMSCLGIDRSEYEARPAMAPHYSVVVARHKLPEFRLQSSKLLLDGNNVKFTERGKGFFTIDFNYHDCQQFSCVELDGKLISFEEIGIVHTQHEDGVYLTGQHIPQGVMLAYDPQRQIKNQQRTQISTLDIAPQILSNFSIPVPSYMNPTSSLW